MPPHRVLSERVWWFKFGQTHGQRDCHNGCFIYRYSLYNKDLQDRVYLHVYYKWYKNLYEKITESILMQHSS